MVLWWVMVGGTGAQGQGPGLGAGRGREVWCCTLRTHEHRMANEDNGHGAA